MHLRSIGASSLACALSFSALGCAVDDAAMDHAAPAERSALASSASPPGPPAFTMKRIGNPAWEPVDFHQVKVNMKRYEPHYFRALLEDVLQAPDHVWNDALGIAPGAAHATPYDSEIGDRIAELGFEHGSIFPLAEVSWPNAFLGTYMVVPTAGAPTGSSPDFDEGPIIPHTLCPIVVVSEIYEHGQTTPVYTGGFDVEALDQIVPPIHVDGHSHFPIFTLISSPPTPGHHFWRLTLTDQAGEGWEVEQHFVITQP